MALAAGASLTRACLVHGATARREEILQATAGIAALVGRVTSAWLRLVPALLLPIAVGAKLLASPLAGALQRALVACLWAALWLRFARSESAESAPPQLRSPR